MTESNPNIEQETTALNEHTETSIEAEVYQDIDKEIQANNEATAKKEEEAAVGEIKENLNVVWDTEKVNTKPESNKIEEIKASSPESLTTKPESSTEKEPAPKQTETPKVIPPKAEVKKNEKAKEEEKKDSVGGGGSFGGRFMGKIKNFFGKLFRFSGKLLRSSGKLLSPFALVGSEISKIFSIKPTEKKK